MKSNNASPFNWQGRPSKFTTDKDRNHYVGVNQERSKLAQCRTSNNAISLPGGSKELPPKMMRPTVSAVR